MHHPVFKLLLLTTLVQHALLHGISVSRQSTYHLPLSTSTISFSASPSTVYYRYPGNGRQLFHLPSKSKVANDWLPLPIASLQGHQLLRFVGDDIKPVKEEIHDDLKYDFRTKTHSV